MRNLSPFYAAVLGNAVSLAVIVRRRVSLHHSSVMSLRATLTAKSISLSLSEFMVK